MLLNFLYIKKEQIKIEIETSPNNVPEVLWLHSIIAFISFITKRLSIKIESYDERLTSKIATQSLILQGVKTGHNKQEIDKTAAAIFLQNYLDEFKK